MLTVYSASAGSGKTYNLVLDYLATCLKPHLRRFADQLDHRHFECPSCTDFQRILAITFTNNAAAEMKERVVKQLNRFAFAQNITELDQNDFNNLCKKIFGAAHPFSEEECFLFIRETSKSLLHSILYDYARFSITTIDSFIQRVIRSSALLFNLSMNYAVQIRLTDFFRMAIEQYVCELPNNQNQFNVVVKELLQQLEEKGGANIHRFLSKALAIIYYDAEKSHPHLKLFPELSDLSIITDFWKQEQHHILETCKKQVEPWAKKALQILQSAEQEGLKANQTYKWDQWFDHIADDPFQLEKGFENSKCHKPMNVEKALAYPKNWSTSMKERHKSQKEHYSNQLNDIFEQIRDIVLKNAKSFFSYRLLSQNANYLLVLNALRDHIENIKNQTNSFFLSESNPLLSDEIENGGGDSLFEKMDRYQNLFIDEFQDTSLMQWFDMKPLIFNVLSNNGNLTLFGDVKQSIYRFRNGEVELFYNLSDYNRLKQSADRDVASLLHDKTDFHYTPLTTNFRSQSAVIEFNNKFFKHYAEQEGWEEYYKEVEQKTRPGKEGGLVQLYGYNKQDYKDIRKIWLECENDFYEEIYLKLPPMAAETIYAVLDARKRGYAFQDITVLLSGRGKCNELARNLMLAGIPVVTSESLQLCDNPNINVIISTLRILTNPNDILSQATIIQYLAHKNHLDPNILWCDLQKSGFFKILEKHFDIQDFKSTLDSWDKSPFPIAVKEILQFYRFPVEADPFIADFLDRVHEYTQTQVAATANFLVWWNDMNRYRETIPRLSLAGSSDAVRLMTIHASKGLEFPVVITQCTTSNRNDTHYWVKDKTSGLSCYMRHAKDMKYSDFQDDYEKEQQKEELDALNLWYVDFTRARDMLYVIADFTEGAKSKQSEGSEEQNGKTNVKKILKEFSETLKKENDIPYFGDFNWKNQKQPDEPQKSAPPIQVTCSELYFEANEHIKVVPSESNTESQEKGTYIHSFLQKLTLFPDTKEKREKLVQGESAEIRARLLHLFEITWSDENLRPYFYPNDEDKVLNEASIITDSGEVRRPDRIILKPDHVMIIDYKTGSEHKTEYEAQLEEYQKCLEKMGFPDVRTKILYIDR